MRALFVTLVCCILSTKALAVDIVTSIKPIQLIVTELTAGITKPRVLVTATASPHDYALKPSDIKEIRGADLVIWFGPELEPFLTRVVGNNPNVVQINQIPNLPLRQYVGEGHGDHDGHNHSEGSVDPHFWLGVEQVRQVSNVITERLILVDPSNTEQYRANRSDFDVRLLNSKKEIGQKLKPLAPHAYYVFHDAYGYFEETFNLSPKGHFTVSPERKPGAKTLMRIRTSLAKDDVRCVFTEPQYTPAVVESVMRGSDAKLGVLDPLATDVKVEKGGYIEFLNDLTASYELCLGEDL